MIKRFLRRGEVMKYYVMLFFLLVAVCVAVWAGTSKEAKNTSIARRHTKASQLLALTEMKSTNIEEAAIPLAENP